VLWILILDSISSALGPDILEDESGDEESKKDSSQRKTTAMSAMKLCCAVDAIDVDKEYFD
jgi:hypothetical protein